MPAYHSVFIGLPNVQLIGNTPLLPLRTRTRGPAQQLARLPDNDLVTELNIEPSHESYDPVDEILALYRANIFFRNFEIKDAADRLLVYGTLFTQEAIGKVKSTMSRREAEKAVLNAALDSSFAIPGEPGFPLNHQFEPPRDRNDAETLRQYLSQLRQEIAVRLVNRLYQHNDAAPNKFWMSYQKRKFLGKQL